MGLRIIYGKPGSGKSTYCFQEISKLINKEKKIFIITPEQFSFTAERKLMENVKSGAVINAEVITLSRMAYRVLKEVGGNDKSSLSKCGKAMLIYSILSTYKKELKFLGKSDENIDLTMSAIAEFKKHGVTVDDLKNEINNTKDTYLKSKLLDMSLLYQKFEEKIKDNYIEETDLLTMLANCLEKTDLVKESIIYIDEFAGFTYQEYQVIKELIKQAKQVNITMCIDNLKQGNNPEADIYYSNKVTLSKMLNLVEENEFKLEQPVELKKQYTVVIVTHNMQQAARISDDTGFFLNGELIEYNNTKDIFTVPVNIAGLPAISVPGGFASNNMPIGLQFIAKSFDEEKLLQVAYTYEQNTQFHDKKPNI